MIEIDALSLNKPVIIAGPCSAETEDQVLQIANDLKDMPIHYYRAGIWKPRTRPNSFEGVGAPGLKWLNRVQEETGLKVITEVAKAQHVEHTLKHNMDALWIGARTTTNPFSVQEIADALEGVDLPIFIKNPINPDLKLWIGAIERIYKAGIKRIAVIHRGFSDYGEQYYRNKPMWQIPIDLRSAFPDITLICDNSHICGRRDILQEVAQQALDLNFDGLMTEVHCTPDEAWSDAAQQITPSVFETMLSELTAQAPTQATLDSEQSITKMRSKIDELDESLLATLGERMKLVHEIGQFKKQHNLPILQTARWKEILANTVLKGDQLGLSKSFIESIFRSIHQESIHHQQHIKKND